MLISLVTDCIPRRVAMSSHGSTENNPPKWFEDWRIKEEKRSKERETWNLGFGIFGTGLSVLAIGLALDNSSSGDSTRAVELLAVGVFATGFGISLMLLSQWIHTRRRQDQ